MFGNNSKRKAETSLDDLESKEESTLLEKKVEESIQDKNLNTLVNTFVDMGLIDQSIMELVQEHNIDVWSESLFTKEEMELAINDSMQYLKENIGNDENLIKYNYTVALDYLNSLQKKKILKVDVDENLKQNIALYASLLSTSDETIISEVYIKNSLHMAFNFTDQFYKELNEFYNKEDKSISKEIPVTNNSNRYFNFIILINK